MAKITGLGGVFIKARDAAALRAWYKDVLGLPLESWGGAQLWNDGPRNYGVWAAFESTSKYFAPSTERFMLNLRVDDLDALLAELRTRGANVLDRREDTPDGKFGYVVDPEGTLIELFEPPHAK
jgi:catechol 2,3-dioxygenase-like lactoylglutathione lyase family enzyme